MLERMNIKRINIAEGILPNVGSELRDERSLDGNAASSSWADTLTRNNFHIPLTRSLFFIVIINIMIIITFIINIIIIIVFGQ